METDTLVTEPEWANAPWRKMPGTLNIERAIRYYLRKHFESVRAAGGQYCHCEHCQDFKNALCADGMKP